MEISRYTCQKRADMSEYFHRQIQLWGEDVQNSLEGKKILIIGSGGLGSSLAYALGSSGIGVIDVVDFDTVGVHNIHRQILFNLNDEGRYKAEVFKEQVEVRYSGVKVRTHLKSVGEFFADNDEEFDLILDATDNISARYEIDAFAKKTATPWIFASVDSFQGEVCFVDKANFDFFPNTKLTPAGIAAPIVMFIASFEANLAIRYLAGLEVKKDLLYYFNISLGELEVRKFHLI